MYPTGIANDAFKDIVIQLQGTLLRHLVSAQHDDSVNDFNVVLEASNYGRVRSVHVLNEMYMRMMQAPPLRAPAGHPMIPQHPMLEYGQAQPFMVPLAESQMTSPPNGYNWNPHLQRSFTEVTGSTWMNPSQPPSRSMTGMTAASSESQLMPLMPNMMNHPALQTELSNGNLAPLPQNKETEENGETGRRSPNPNKRGLRQMFASPKPHNPPLPQENPRRQPVPFPQPASIYSSPDQQSLTGSRSSTSLSAPSSDVTSSPRVVSPVKLKPAEPVKVKIPMKESPPAEYRKRLNNKPKPKPQRTVTQPVMSTTASRDAITPPSTKSRKFSFPLVGSSKSSKVSDYGGFCKGASLMQTGNHGVKLRNQSVSMTGQSNYWSCSNNKCCFEGPALQSKDEEKKVMWGFDDSIRDMYGVRYRWSFLAKSHVEIGNSKGGYEYQCAFCAGQGKACAKLKGERAFIEHVSTHQGQRPDPFKMFLLNWIAGRAAPDEAIFDVNLAAPYEKEPGLGIHMDERRETVHSMDVNIMMQPEDTEEWQDRRDQSEILADQYKSMGRTATWNSTAQTTPDLRPAPLFSSSSLNGKLPVHTKPTPPTARTRDARLQSRSNGHTQDYNTAVDGADPVSYQQHVQRDHSDEDPAAGEEYDEFPYPEETHPAFRVPTDHADTETVSPSSPTYSHSQSHPYTQNHSNNHNGNGHYQYHNMRISIPDPWRTSYATLASSRHDSVSVIGGGDQQHQAWSASSPVKDHRVVEVQQNRTEGGMF